MYVQLVAKTIVVDPIPGYLAHPDDDLFPTDADDLAEMAGRLCYLAWLRKNPATATNRSYLENIIKQGHFSVLEHSTASFYIDQVTRAFLLELERHRHLSYSVVSQRYVPGSKFRMVEHPVLTKLRQSTKDKIAALDEEAHKLYEEIVAELEELGDSADPHRLRKEARGAARTVLPEGTETRLLVSGNMRAWMELLWKRISPSADKEICMVAERILDELMSIAPNTFQNFQH
jgi:thymidylate synthase (FAD)